MGRVLLGLFGALVGAEQACGMGQAASPDAPDGGVQLDGGTVDATDGGASRVERATGQHLVTSSAMLEGLTSDGYIVFSATGSDGLTVAKAVRVEGGDEITLAKSNGSGKADLRVAVHGRVAFIWTDRGNRMANLTIWSKATGPLPVGAGVRPGRAAATVDGTHVTFMRDVTDATASIVAGPIAGPYSVIGTMDATGSCWQNADLATAGGGDADGTGAAAPPRLFAQFCTPGSAALALRSAAPDGSGSFEVAADIASVAYGKTRVLWRETSGALKAAAPDGTDVATIAAQGAAEAAMTSSDSAVVFRTANGAIQRAAIDGGAPANLVDAGGAKLLGGVSNGGEYVLYATQVDDRGSDFVGPYTDVKLAGSGASATSLVTTTTSCPGCLADSFSSDGSLAVVLDPIDNTKAAGGVGVLRSFDIRTGAPVASTGSRVYTAVALGSAGGISSRFLVVEATPDPSLVSGFSFGLTTQDLRSSANGTEIGAGVEAVTVDATRTHAVYSFAAGSPLAAKE
jgi:hypothetical protein